MVGALVWVRMRMRSCVCGGAGVDGGRGLMGSLFVNFLGLFACGLVVEVHREAGVFIFLTVFFVTSQRVIPFRC